MRDRGSAVLINNNQVALIKRLKNGMEYYVFPGGGIEKGETPEEATKREAFEELGVTITIGECLMTLEFNGTQYFYLGKITDGVFGTGTGEEFTDANRESGTYEPMWVDINDLPNLNVKPREVADNLYNQFDSERK